MIKYSIFILLIFSYTNCNKPKSNVVNPTTPFFAKGADISWVTEMETAGKKFYSNSNVPTDLFSLVKNLGLNAIRLRVWVNPTAGYNNANDVLIKAQRAQALGLKLLIDFHYSDSWADPGQQTIPTAWSTMNFADIQTALYNHTFSVLQLLKSNGIIPVWVQIGNETNNGMLWPIGKASLNMANFAQLVNKGYDAVKAVDSSILACVHVSNGYDNNLSRWVFDGLIANQAKFDFIALSLYPDASNWTQMNINCMNNVTDLISRYNKKVMIAEVGMPWDEQDACKSFMIDLISKMKTLSGKGLGVFYWEPECYANWNGYTKGAFDNSGKPTVALDAFK